MATFYIIFSISIACAIGLYIALKCTFSSKRYISKHSALALEKFNNITDKILKSLAIAYFVLIFLCIFLPDAFAISYSDYELTQSAEEISFAIVRWFSALTYIMLPIAVFYKNRTIRNVTSYFCLAMTVVSIIFYPTYLQYYTSTLGQGLNSISVFSMEFKQFLFNPVFRSIILGLQWFIEIFVIVVMQIKEKHIFNFKDKREYLNFFLVLVFSLLECIPIFVPQHLFGYSNIIFKAWSLPHIIWILLIILVITSLYLIFKNKSREVKKIVLLVLALTLFFQYNQMFSAIFIKVKRLPFQICNIGAFLILISLLTENRHIFNFTVIVNVVGVLFALAVPDLANKGLFYLYNMHFIFEHTNVLVVPVLALLLDIFPRLDKTALKDCIIGFSCYYLFVLVLGTIFNAIASKTGNSFYEANYLFMFNQADAANLLEFLGAFFETQIHIGSHITFYPFAQIVVYTVFLSVCILMYFLIRLIYKIKDKIKAPQKTEIEQNNQKL